MKIQLINVGRDNHCGEIDCEDGHNEFEVGGRICLEARKRLRSGNIEVFFDGELHGSITAGGRTVGRFEITEGEVKR